MKNQLLTDENYNNYNSSEDIPDIYHKVNEDIPFSSESALEKTAVICKYLAKHVKGGPGLGTSSGRALKIMLEGNYGVCSDISQVFNNFCILNDIKVREWGVVDKFYKESYGHSFNEIFSEELDKWIAVDPSKCLFFYDPKNETPLSAEELFTRGRQKLPLKYECFGENVDIDDPYIRAIYFSPKAIPFMLYNYKIKTIDTVLDKFPKFPNFLISTLLIMLRKHFRYMMLFNDHKRLWNPKTQIVTQGNTITEEKASEPGVETSSKSYKLSN
ncbi:hypothetical protein [Sungkyunkwania multivorans]